MFKIFVIQQSLQGRDNVAEQFRSFTILCNCSRPIQPIGQCFDECAFSGLHLTLSFLRRCCPAVRLYSKFSAQYGTASREIRKSFLSLPLSASPYIQHSGFTMACVPPDNGLACINRFSQPCRDRVALLEKAAADPGVRHKPIRPCTPRHSGKADRSRREDQRRFYGSHAFCPPGDLCVQLAEHGRAAHNHPMRLFGYTHPVFFFVPILSNMFDKLTSTALEQTPDVDWYGRVCYNYDEKGGMFAFARARPAAFVSVLLARSFARPRIVRRRFWHREMQLIVQKPMSVSVPVRDRFPHSICVPQNG